MPSDDPKKCPECGAERSCLVCSYGDSSDPYIACTCLRGHYGVVIGEGCEDFKCGHEERVR